MRTRTAIRTCILAAVLVVGTGVIRVRATAPGSLSDYQIASPPTAAGQSATLLPDGRWLLLGGLENGEPSDAAQVLDRAAGAAAMLPSHMLFVRAFHTATVLPDGRVFVFGGVGRDGADSNSAEIFDPASNSFSPFPLTNLGPRSHHNATLLTNGELLIAGGSGHRDAILFDPVAKTPVRSISGPDSAWGDDSSVLLADGSVLLWSGVDAQGTPRPIATLFNPGDLTFSLLEASWANELTERSPAAQPAVAATIPVDGDGAVAVDTRIAVRFSKYLQVTSVNTNTVTLAGRTGRVAARVVATNNGQQLFVTPATELMPATRYTLSMNGLTDGTRYMPFTAIDFTTAAIDDLNDEPWVPSAQQLAGDWKTKETDSPWVHQSPLRAAPGVTALAGQVLRLNSQPLPNATLRIGNRSVRTDKTGRFLLTGVRSGSEVLTIDGGTAGRGTTTYGLYQAKVDIAAGRTNVLGYTIWMTALDTRHTVDISSPTTSETVVTTPLIPNLELRIPAGTLIRDLDGKVVTRISITPIPVNRPPFPLPNVRVPVYFTIQPGGAVLQGISATDGAGARLIYPNFDHQPPGGKVNFWNYEADDEGWYVYGQGTISDDGVHAVPDPGVVIYEFTGAMIADPQNSGAPGKSPTAGGSKGGEPVDLSTGLFTYEHTDLYLPDVIPLALTRRYNSGDGLPRAFGIDTNFDYGAFLYSAGGGSTLPTDLFLGDGSDIKYTCISACGSLKTAVLQAQTTPTRFYLSTIKYQTAVQFGYSLSLLDGTTYYFLGDAYATHQLAAIRDRYGNQVTVTGNGSPITRVTSPNGRWISFSYSNTAYPNCITSATDSAGRTVKYTYDTSGRLITFTDANGGATTYAYDSSHRIVSITDPRHITFITNVYDGSGQVTDQTLGDGASKYHFAYTAGSSGSPAQTDVTDPNGHVRRVQFNTDGYPTSETRAYGTPLAETTTYVRGVGSNPNLLRSSTDSLNRTTTDAYDAVGNTTGVTFLSGTSGTVSWKFTYEPQFQQLQTTTDPLGHVTSFVFDGGGRISQSIDALGHTTSFVFDDEGRLQSVTDPLNHTTSYEYAGADLVALTNALGQTSTRFADAAGRTVSLTDPLGNQTVRTYDNNDNVLTVTDPLGHTVSLAYDPDDNLLSVTSPNSGITRYAYDALGQRIARTDPLGRTDTYIFDGVGNELRHTDRKGQITIGSYDVLDRLGQITYGDASTITLNRDAGNRVVSLADSLNGTITRGYDLLDRLTQEVTPQGTVNYRFDGANRKTSMSAAGGTPVNYAYDNDNRLLTVTQGTSVVAIVYDDANRVNSVTLPNGIVGRYTFDSRDMLTSLTYQKSGATLDTMSYGYDAVARNVNFASTLGQLNKAITARTSRFNAADQILTVGGATYTYDNDGNLVNDGVNSYTWNARNQLIGISGGLSASFSYDVFGRRTSRTVGGTATTFQHDGANLIQEVSGGKTVRYLTGPGLDQVFSRTDLSGTVTYLRDGLGSILGLADGTGSILTQYQYDPYGNTTTSGAASPNALQYAGRENDGTGLYYCRARYYSPALGTFVSIDPIGLAGGLNDYAYVGGNPIQFSDPTGYAAAPAVSVTATWGEVLGGQIIITNNGNGTLSIQGGPGLAEGASETVTVTGPNPGDPGPSPGISGGLTTSVESGVGALNLSANITSDAIDSSNSTIGAAVSGQSGPAFGSVYTPSTNSVQPQASQTIGGSVFGGPFGRITFPWPFGPWAPPGMLCLGKKR
jgi:RHS repeat-associated protein